MNPQTYTVKSGDTLSAIGQQFGVDYNKITGYSSGNPNLIRPGEVLTIPGNNPTPTPINSTIPANQIQPPTQLNLPTTSAQSQYVSGLTSQIDAIRSQLDSTLGQRKAEADAKLADAQTAQQDTLSTLGDLSTPFRADLQTAQNESLFVNQNFQANQNLVNELDTLLTQGNDLIKQQQSVTGLSAVRNPRVQKTMSDVAARAGVIQAVISARNGQIAQAQTMIDRSINAITADRNDQVSYYNTVLSLNNQKVLSLDAESKKIAQEQVDLISNDLTRAQASTDYVKQLMVNPDSALLMAEGGVTLNDSVETINAKLANATSAREVKDQANKITMAGGVLVASPAGIPQNQLSSFTDSNGHTYYYKMPAPKVTGGITPYEQTQLDQQKQVGFERAISDGIAQLQKGATWGEVWSRVHSLYPEAPAQLIDQLLGPSWKQPGAFQTYAANQGKIPLNVGK